VPEKRQATSKKRITGRSTPVRRPAGKTDWNRLAALDDGTIRKAIASDPDAAPIADAAWFRGAKIVLPEPKKAVSIRLDRDVMEWFQRQGKGYLDPHQRRSPSLRLRATRPCLENFDPA
jgi:uncharacterized protein (DUF4415 family)